MLIKIDSCIGCRECIPYCPMNALKMNKGKIEVDRMECVECNICYYSGTCPTGAISVEELNWPRKIRTLFSDPLQSNNYPSILTKVIKQETDSSNSLDVWIAIELGRPCVGTRFYDVEKIIMAMMETGCEIEADNLIADLIIDKNTGKLVNDVLDEKVLSATVRFRVKINMVTQVLKTLRKVSSKIKTVFSVYLISDVNQDNHAYIESFVKNSDIDLSINGKTNIGISRTKVKEG